MIEQKIKDYLKSVKTFENEMKVYITNKNIDLTERWNIFTKYNFGDKEDYIPEFLDVEFLRNDVEIDRYIEVSNKSYIEFLEGYDKDINLINHIKELFMSNWIQSFMDDW